MGILYPQGLDYPHAKGYTEERLKHSSSFTSDLETMPRQETTITEVVKFLLSSESMFQTEQQNKEERFIIPGILRQSHTNH